MPLSDLLSCPEDELEAIITNEEPYSSGAWFQAKNIGTIQLCKLGELLGVGSYRDLKSGFGLVGEPLPDGPWPETIHPALIAKLREISDAQIQSVVNDWARTDELAGVSSENLADYLTGLRDFLRQQQNPIFLINAL